MPKIITRFVKRLPERSPFISSVPLYDLLPDSEKAVKLFLMFFCNSDTKSRFLAGKRGGLSAELWLSSPWKKGEGKEGISWREAILRTRLSGPVFSRWGAHLE